MIDLNAQHPFESNVCDDFDVGKNTWGYIENEISFQECKEILNDSVFINIRSEESVVSFSDTFKVIGDSWYIMVDGQYALFFSEEVFLKNEPWELPYGNCYMEAWGGKACFKFIFVPKEMQNGLFVVEVILKVSYSDTITSAIWYFDPEYGVVKYEADGTLWEIVE